MYKMLALLCVVAVAYAQQQYPAGVSPAECPNYPYCNTVIPIAGHRAIGPHTNWAQRYPAGVHPAVCPNYPYCGTGVEGPAGYRVNSNPALAYPAGVSAAACPNYPYCH